MPLDKIQRTVTVFTPTYNRDKYISNLFDSLCKQTIFPCEWIIVDQGNDGTRDLVKGFMEKANFLVIYKRLEGERGIGRALNLMMGIAQGNLVMKVDDADTLTPAAIEPVIKMESTIDDKEKYAGVSGLRQYPDGRVIGGEWCHDTKWFDCTNLEREKNGLGGDKAEAYYLDVLKEFGPIPTIQGEYFTWEGVLWDRIAHAGKKIRWFNKKIYCTQYLPGGSTDTRIEARKNNFYTYTVLVSERMSYSEIPFSSRLKQCCRYFEVAREKEIPYRKVKHYFDKCRSIALLGYIGSIITKHIPQNNPEYRS